MASYASQQTVRERHSSFEGAIVVGNSLAYPLRPLVDVQEMAHSMSCTMPVAG